MRLLILTTCFILIGLQANARLEFVKYNQQENKCSCDDENADFSDVALLKSIKNGDINDAGLLACTHHCLALYYNYKRDYFSEIKQNKTAIKIREKNQDSLLWKSYRNIGYTYSADVGYYKKGIEALEKAMQLNETFVKNVWGNIKISFCYGQIGEYEKALEYAQKAFSLAQSDIDFGRVYNNLSIIHTKIADTENLQFAAEYARKAIQFYEKANWQDGIAVANINLGNALELLKNYEEAIDAYNLALEVYKKDNPLRYETIQNNIAVVLNKQNKQKEAIYLLNESLEVLKKHYDNSLYNSEYAVNYKNLGDSYTSLGEYETALENYDKALDNLKDDIKSKNPYIYRKPYYIRILDFKAQALKMKGDTKLAAQIYQKIDSWITTLYRDLSTNTSKLVWIERAHKMYGNAIEVALMMGDKERAFQYAEKAHAVLLWQNLSQEAALSLLSEDDREKRDNLIAQLCQTERQYQSGKTNIRTLRAREDEKEKFEEELEKNYPEYAQRKYQTESTTVAQVKDMIDSNTAFIEYYWTDEVLQIFTITKDDFTVHTQSAEGLADQIAEFQSLISQPICDTDCTKNTYNSLAFNLYKKLIPNEIRTNSKINRLVIVADKAIGTLPFSALATEKWTSIFDHDYPFLLKKYATNYLYSAGSFSQFQQENTSGAKGFAGFAPVEYQISDRTFAKLDKAGEQVKTIAEMYPSNQQKVYTRAAATKQNFVDALKGNHHTILLATHAEYKNQKGEIAFQSEVMNQNEIDQLNGINIQRLMLSACETAKGKQNAGEGVLSLGWNFAYKGVPSITMTHWSVNEGTTMQIMVDYNDALRKGTSADQALQQAQIAYLDKTFDNHQPFYWAAIVHAGNPEDVFAFDLFDMSLHWFLVVFLIGLFGYAALRR